MKLLISRVLSSEHVAFTFYSWCKDFGDKAREDFWLKLFEHSPDAFSNFVILAYIAKKKAKEGEYIVDQG